MSDRTYIAIDLKSFYASVECIERGFDPMTTNLVVADNSRTDKTICLLSGLTYLEKNLFSYHYICIGEEDDDKVELMFNVFTRPPLELEYPYVEART